ncbi:serine/threonine-protein kinase [Streptomyces sp. NPDC059385]|uniref:serine/threonine-protein kinase n=1 Tax=Streptomyces sp. NPDC059385 TaxID=3346817 RepID=UPI00369F4F4D
MGDVFAAGETLSGGRYRIVGLLGTGGMAQVFRAFDGQLARAVAIKVMLPEIAAQAGGVERFRRESQAMAALTHPNVVTVHDSGVERRQGGLSVPYFVMELVTGPSLADHMGEGRALDVPTAVHVADQVLAALEASHERGLVHRDIKPSNILMAEGGAIKVSDFGIARAFADPVTTLTAPGRMIGTPAYMSPEQLMASGALDGRSDLYAVGVLLFEMLTGQRPFAGPDVARLHLDARPPALASAGLTDRPGLEEVVARALRKRREQRYPDATAMRAALRSALAPPAPPPAPTQTWSHAPVWEPTPDTYQQPATAFPVPGIPGRPVAPLRPRLLHGLRLAVCVYLFFQAFWLGARVQGYNTDPHRDQDLALAYAWAMLATALTGVLAARPSWLSKSRWAFGGGFRGISLIVMCFNMYPTLMALLAVMVGGKVAD